MITKEQLIEHIRSLQYKFTPASVIVMYEPSTTSPMYARMYAMSYDAIMLLYRLGLLPKDVL